MPSIFVLGDSVSMQYGPHLQQALGDDFSYSRKGGTGSALADIEVPEDANGGDSALCLAYLQSLAKANRRIADIVLLNSGLHDVKTDHLGAPLQVSVDDYEANLRAILRLADTLFAQIIWVRTTPVSEANHNKGEGTWRHLRDVDQYNAIADHVMREHDVASIDLYAMSMALGPADEILPDGRHFRPDVQARQGCFIAGYVNGWCASHPENHAR